MKVSKHAVERYVERIETIAAKKAKVKIIKEIKKKGNFKYYDSDTSAKIVETTRFRAIIADEVVLTVIGLKNNNDRQNIGVTIEDILRAKGIFKNNLISSKI